MPNWSMFAVLLSACAISLATPAYATCNVGDFKSDDAGQLSDVQQFSYLSMMSKTQYEVIKAGGRASGAYELISGSANYQEFKEKINKVMSVLKIENFSSYHQSWSQSALDANGLAGYRACLTQEGGFYLTVASLSADEEKLSIDWRPGPFGEMKKAPVVHDFKNIANVEEIKNLLGDKAWLSNEKHFNIPIRRLDTSKAADLTIKTPHTSETVFLPPPAVPIIRQPSKPRGSWASDTDPSNIIQVVPFVALGGKMELRVEANAYSHGTGWMQIIVSLETASGTHQMCATQRTTQSINMGLSLPCEFDVSWDAKRVLISAPNGNADAKSVHAEVFY